MLLFYSQILDILTIYKTRLIVLLALLSSQIALADNLGISKDEIVGEWRLLATQLGENGPKYEEDGASMIIFTGDGKLVEKGGLGSFERTFHIENEKLFVTAPIGPVEWIVKEKSNSNITLETPTGLLYLAKQM